MRLYEPSITLKKIGENHVLSLESAHHFSRVMRGKQGEVVEVFDGKGAVFSASVTNILRHQIELKILESRVDDSQTQLGRQILVVAVCQRQKMSWIIEKATELGVSEIHPLITERVQAFTVKQFDEQTQSRFEKVAIAAAMQSGVNQLPLIHMPSTLSSLPWSNWHGALLLCDLNGGNMELTKKEKDKVWFIGPEGGWTKEELHFMYNKHCRGVRIAQHVLRMETAAIVALALGANLSSMA